MHNIYPCSIFKALTLNFLERDIKSEDEGVQGGQQLDNLRSVHNMVLIVQYKI